MTNLDALRDELKNSTKPLDAEFWKKQNKMIAKMQLEFAEKEKAMRMSPEDLRKPFDI